MERQGIHELSAAYALDALDGDDRRRFDVHLAQCEGCRDDVASFQAAAAALAYDVDVPAPPDGLRERILERARSERPSNVLEFRPRRWALPVASGIAAAAACAALVLGLWGASVSSDLDRERIAHARSQQALNVLAEGGRRVPLAGAEGALVLDPDSGRGWLVVFSLDKAPSGKTYEAWVISEDKPLAAGLFPGGGLDTLVPLAVPVRRGDTVAVTLERAGGVQQPTGEPVFTAETA
jgi:anti-sigma-K factor RskA